MCPSFRLEHACAHPAYPRDPHALLIMLRARQSSLGAPPRVEIDLVVTGKDMKRTLTLVAVEATMWLRVF